MDRFYHYSILEHWYRNLVIEICFEGVNDYMYSVVADFGKANLPTAKFQYKEDAERFIGQIEEIKRRINKEK